MAKKKMKYAVYTGSRNLYPDMVTAVKSLLMNSDVDKIYLLIEDDEFPYELPPEVECINVSDQKFFPPDGPNMQSQFTYFALMRAALCHVFPKIDTILSLDVDTIVDRDISDIWNEPLGDEYYFAGCKEPERSVFGFLSVNAGVVLFNLKKLRDGKADEVIDTLNRQWFKWVDQDVFSYLCQGRILEINGDYNANPWVKHSNVPKIMHYATIKDYRDKRLVRKYRDISWEEIAKARKEKYGKHNKTDSVSVGENEGT